MKTSPWIVRPAPSDSAGIRLFCLPYAGGGALLYRSWPSTLPASVEVCAIQLPGRENRLAEPLMRNMPELIADITAAVSPWLDRPFAFFGHSLGSLLAFELARSLRAKGGPLPDLLIASGRPAPHYARTHIIHNLSDVEFVQEVRKLGGTPDEVLDHEDLRRLFLPVLRADIGLCETYVCAEEAPLSCPIVAFGGAADPDTPMEALREWRMHTNSAFSMRVFPGGHFFLHSESRAVVAAVGQELLSFMALNANIY